MTKEKKFSECSAYELTALRDSLKKKIKSALSNKASTISLNREELRFLKHMLNIIGWIDDTIDTEISLKFAEGFSEELKNLKK